MAGVFACPECGEEVAVEGNSPGREVLCDACSTWVEVPYLPRAAGPQRTRRSSRRSPWNSLLLKGAIGFAVVALLGLVASKMIGGRVRSGQEQILNGLIREADQAEAEHRPDTALFQIESALAQARVMKLENSSRYRELADRRDRIAVREIQERLAAVDALGPDQAVGEAKTLAKKVAENPALADLAEPVEARLAALLVRQAEADLEAARQAFDAGRDSQAFDAAARLHDRAGDLSRSDASRFQAEARSILETTVARKGVCLPPVDGRFVAGSAQDYTRALDRTRTETLRAKGYLPEPRNSPWSSLWEEKAPFRATIQVVESQDDLYLQSKNRTTQVDGTLELFRGNRSIWTNRVFARTRVPLPDLPALLAGHLATSDKRKPETEQMLHADAMKQFVEHAAKNLRGLPDLETTMRKP